METRLIHTRVWEDEWFSGLSKDGKLLFIYLLSNKEIGKSGAFERPMRVISFDTGIGIEDLKGVFKELEEKIQVIGSYVFVKNAYKYQNYFKESATEKQKQGVVNEINRLPDEVRSVVIEQILTSYNLVSNYILTRINNKYKIKKEEEKKEIKKKEKKIPSFVSEINRKYNKGEEVSEVDHAKKFVDRSVILKVKKQFVDASSMLDGLNEE